jgi:predicted DNA-binding protein
MRKSGKQTAVRLTPEAERLLKELAAKFGLNHTSVIEMAIRKFAEQEGIK